MTFQKKVSPEKALDHRDCRAGDPFGDAPENKPPDDFDLPAVSFLRAPSYSVTVDAGVPECTLEGSGEEVTDEELRLARSGEKME